MAGGRQSLTADTKTLWAFLSGTRWTPTSATDGSVEGPCLPGIAVMDCLGTERGNLHLPIPSPACGTAEDASGISVTSIPLRQQDTVSSSLPAAPGAGCVGGFSKSEQEAEQGMFWKQHLLQLVWNPPFPGGQKAWRRVTADVTFPGSSLCSQLPPGCAQLQCNTLHLPTAPMDPRNSMLSLSQSVQGSFLPCFPEELQGWCPPLHRVLVALVSPVPAASPGPLTASASFQGISGQAGEIFFC